MNNSMPPDIWNWDVIFSAGVQLAGIGVGILLIGLFIKSYCLYVMGRKK